MKLESAKMLTLIGIQCSPCGEQSDTAINIYILGSPSPSVSKSYGEEPLEGKYIDIRSDERKYSGGGDDDPA